MAGVVMSIGWVVVVIPLLVWDTPVMNRKIYE
jgi:hypothetical protein